jgi:hypothetical protein
MSPVAKTLLSIAACAVIGVGVALWARFGGLVYFDALAASFIGCFL